MYGKDAEIEFVMPENLTLKQIENGNLKLDDKVIIYKKNIDYDLLYKKNVDNKFYKNKSLIKAFG